MDLISEIQSHRSLKKKKKKKNKTKKGNVQMKT